ncbi:hypothetical protein PGT21_036373 [Puccinia graminis f. sp. tritici]|uniref:Uncharacterized protein n=1 Tax=Puccinia graminis f. sp. tritici TaxID=56615 RepID=A0A5B0NUW5_PUCGR|nr:hypothetical protein PGTUg99_037548 [Puccinia graminis f. sp. tritici]KAA1091628.1 hypothetical protein PGT21_036373 [Puccinia graminis f. sp. tritici]
MSSSTAENRSPESQQGGLDAVRDAPKAVATRMSMGAATQKLMEKLSSPSWLGSRGCNSEDHGDMRHIMLQRHAESREERTFPKKKCTHYIEHEDASGEHLGDDAVTPAPSLRSAPSGRRLALA